jgi:hypothetical protein
MKAENLRPDLVTREYLVSRGEEILQIVLKGEAAGFVSYQLTIVAFILRICGANELALAQTPGFKQTDVMLTSSPQFATIAGAASLPHACRENISPAIPKS